MLIDLEYMFGIRVLFIIYLFIPGVVLGQAPQPPIPVSTIDSIINNSLAVEYDHALTSLQHYRAEASDLIESITYLSKEIAIRISQGKLNKAEPLFRSVDSLCKQSNCYPVKAKVEFQRARWYMANHNLTAALETILQSILNLEKQSPTSSDLGSHYAICAYYYNLLGDFASSESYLKKSLNHHLQYAENERLGDIYNNLGILAKKQEKWTQSISYFKQAQKEDANHSHPVHRLKTINNIASCYIEMQQLDSVFFYLSQSYAYPQEWVDQSTIYQNFLIFFTETNQLDSAEKYKRLALHKVQQSFTSPTQMASLYEIVASYYQSTNQLDSAYYYKERELALKEELWYGTEKQEIITKSEQRAKIKFQQELIQTLEEKNYYQSLSIRQQKVLIFVVLGLFLASILVGGLILYQRNLRYQKNQLEMQQQLLHTQMNPHFIFNALTAIQNSILEGDHLLSASYLASFAKLIRQNFDYVDKQWIPLEDEIELLETYIETQLMRFPDLFMYQFDISEEIDTKNMQIPPFMLQPVVENAIEHGFQNIQKQGELSIRLALANKKLLQCTVSDNGIGFQHKETDEKHALGILRDRLQLINGSHTSNLTIKKLDAGGTSISFFIRFVTT